MPSDRLQARIGHSTTRIQRSANGNGDKNGERVGG
jgi:hypothetical protein